MRAFLNHNNRKGWLMEETPEQPVEEEIAALFLVVVAQQIETFKQAKLAVKKEAARNRRKLTPRPVARTPLEEFEQAKNDPRWQKPWLYAAYHEARRLTDAEVVYPGLGPLRADEYYSRRTKAWQKLTAAFLANFEPTFDVEAFLNDSGFEKHLMATRVDFSYQSVIEKNT